MNNPFKPIVQFFTNIFGTNNVKPGSWPILRENDVTNETVPNKHLRGTAAHADKIKQAEKYYYDNPELYAGGKT